MSRIPLAVAAAAIVGIAAAPALIAEAAPGAAPRPFIVTSEADNAIFNSPCPKGADKVAITVKSIPDYATVMEFTYPAKDVTATRKMPRAGEYHAFATCMTGRTEATATQGAKYTILEASKTSMVGTWRAGSSIHVATTAFAQGEKVMFEMSTQDGVMNTGELDTKYEAGRVTFQLPLHPEAGRGQYDFVIVGLNSRKSLKFTSGVDADKDQVLQDDGERTPAPSSRPSTSERPSTGKRPVTPGLPKTGN